MPSAVLPFAVTGHRYDRLMVYVITEYLLVRDISLGILDQKLRVKETQCDRSSCSNHRMNPNRLCSMFPE